MNERRIACFLAVMKNLNFSRAAEQLFTTQPALSYQIDSLERELGVKLFERTTTSVRLTEAGLAFAAPAEKFYRQYLEAVSAVRGYTNKKNHIVLACPRVMIARDKIYHVLIARIVETLPQYEVEVRVFEKNMNFWTDLSGGIDCIISMKPAIEEDGVEYYPLFQTRVYIVVSPQHALAGCRGLVPADLSGQTLYYEEGDLEYADILRRAVEQNGAAAKLKEAVSYDTVYPYLVAGKGLFISPMAYECFPREWYIPMKIDGVPPTVLMCLKEPARPCVRILVQLIRQVYRENTLPMEEL